MKLRKFLYQALLQVSYKGTNVYCTKFAHSFSSRLYFFFFFLFFPSLVPQKDRLVASPAISKSRRGIGMIKYLSKYLPRQTLNGLYKLYVRPHLDYSDVIYHIPATKCDYSGSLKLNHMMEKLESVQYRSISSNWCMERYFQGETV